MPASLRILRQFTCLFMTAATCLAQAQVQTQAQTQAQVPIQSYTLQPAQTQPQAQIQAVQADMPLLQDPQIVRDIVEQFVATQAESLPGTARVIVDQPRLNNQPACDDLEPFLPGSKKLRSRMSVGVRCLGPTLWTLYVPVNLVVDGFYYVTNRTLQPGDLVSLDDITAREGDILRLSGGVLTEAAQVIGYIVTQRIPSGSPIKATALRDPNSIQRGQTVRTIAQGTGFIATSEGQAMQSGGPGSRIQVRSASGQIITGIVVDANTVMIPM